MHLLRPSVHALFVILSLLQYLFPGHGLAVKGEQAVQEILLNTAKYLRHIVDGVLSMMNEGHRPDDIFHAIEPHPELSRLPYLGCVRRLSSTRVSRRASSHAAATVNPSAVLDTITQSSLFGTCFACTVGGGEGIRPTCCHEKRMTSGRR